MLRTRRTPFVGAFCLALACLLTSTGCDDPMDRVSETGMFMAGADQIYYEVLGVGYPIVLIGGGSGMDLRQWDEVFPALAENFVVIRYDPRGVGSSDNPTETYSDADDLQELIYYLGYKRVVAVGVSSAGGTALEFAAAHPHRVSAVIGASPFVPGFEFDEAMQKRLQAFSEAAEQGREPFLDAMLDDDHFIPAPLVPEVREVARANMGENFDKGASVDPAFIRRPFPPLINRLEDLRTPMLLLTGELDHPEIHRRNEAFQKRIAGSVLQTIPEAGHNAPLENPTAFVAAIEPFLDKILAAVREP